MDMALIAAFRSNDTLRDVRPRSGALGAGFLQSMQDNPWLQGTLP
jgi:hypothetical protein